MQILGGTPQHANFGWNPNTRDKKYMILIMSKKLTKLDGIQLMRKSFDTLLNWITQSKRRLIKSKQKEKKTKQK